MQPNIMICKRSVKAIFFSAVMVLLVGGAKAQFSVSANKRYLLKNNKPFFWMGDTAWQLFNTLTKEEADHICANEANKASL